MFSAILIEDATFDTHILVVGFAQKQRTNDGLEEKVMSLEKTVQTRRFILPKGEYELHEGKYWIGMR